MNLLGDEPIRGEVRQAGFRRVSHGLYLPIRDNLSNGVEFRRELRAWLLVLPSGTRFTHVTGARLRGWRLPALPEQVPVFAAVHAGQGGPRRAGLIYSRLSPRDDRDPEDAVVDGLPVDTAEEILLRAARDLGHLDLVIMIDSAMQRGDIDDARMQSLLDSRRPGTRALAAAYRAADPRAESAGETVLRIFHNAMDFAVESQVDLTDDAGGVIGRADLLVTGTTWVHEYDGAVHRDRAQHGSDLRRERRLAGTAYVRRGFALDDLLNHAAVVMHELDRAAGRVHQARRLRRWRRMIDYSMYSPDGRGRVLNRWRRAMGVVDWSRIT